MFEEITYEDILERMLDRVPDTYDKRESSPIYFALAPVALEVKNMYNAFDDMMDETFGDTADLEYLIRLAAERGLEQIPATYAVVQGEFTPIATDIPIGSQFTGDEQTYEVTEKVSDGVYKLSCTEAGIVGNDYTGNLVPVDDIENLETAAITKILINGEDAEDVEALRSRYFASMEQKSFSGNIADYTEKTLAIQGVGAVKIEPVWNGAGTVRLTILDSKYDKATNTLIETVQNEFDPNGDGMGNGLAPIGHIVTVQTAEEVEIVITATITFDTGYSWNTHQTQIEDSVKSYLLALRTGWEASDSIVVRIAQIESRIVSIDGILDITGTTLNEGTENLTLSEYQIPVFGGVSA